MRSEYTERQRVQQISASIAERLRKSPVLSGVHRAVEDAPIHADRYMQDLLLQLATGQITTLVLGGLPGSGKSTILHELENILHTVRPDLVVETLTYSDTRKQVQDKSIKETGHPLSFADERIQATRQMTEVLIDNARSSGQKVVFAEMVILPVTDPQTGEILDRGLSTLDALVPYIKEGRVIVPFLGPDPSTMLVGTNTRGKQSTGGDPAMLLRLQLGAFRDSQERQAKESPQRKQKRAQDIRFPQGIKLQDRSPLETGREIAQFMRELLQERGVDTYLTTIVWNPMNPRYSRYIRRSRI